MHAKVQEKFHAIVRGSHVRVRRALEVGGVAGPDSLLLFPELEGAERFSLNLVGMPSTDGITAVVGNANDMTAFEDETFDLVMSNATLEHDRYFWLSVSEMRRVLAPGGLLIIGTPGYTEDHERDHGLSTHTYRVHYRFDYYRFSEQTFRDVFFDDMDRVDVQAILTPPRIIGHGYMPLTGAQRLRDATRALATPPSAVRRRTAKTPPGRLVRRLLRRQRPGGRVASRPPSRSRPD